MPTIAAGQSSPTADGLFTRQASGLVREIGIPAAAGISLASVALSDTFINFNAGLTDFARRTSTSRCWPAAIWFVAMFAYRYLLKRDPTRRRRVRVPVADRAPRRRARWRASRSRSCSPRCSRPTPTSWPRTRRSCYSPRRGFQEQLDRQRRQPRGQQRRDRRDQCRRDARRRGSLGVLAEALAQIILGLIVLQLLAFLILALLLADHSHATSSPRSPATATTRRLPGVIAAAKSNGVAVRRLVRRR